MNKVQQLIVLIGLTIFLTSTFLFTSENYAFAIEFSNYTSEKYGIYFEYPSNWIEMEKNSRFESGPDITLMSLSISTYIAIISTDTLKNPGFDLRNW